MERQERIRISPRARKLISRAFVLGVAPADLRSEVDRTIDIVKEVGRERIMREDLRDLAQEVRSRLDSRIKS